MSTTVKNAAEELVDGEMVVDGLDIDLRDDVVQIVNLNDVNTFFYDIGYDMLVMQTELGCPLLKRGCAQLMEMKIKIVCL